MQACTTLSIPGITGMSLSGSGCGARVNHNIAPVTNIEHNPAGKNLTIRLNTDFIPKQIGQHFNQRNHAKLTLPDKKSADI